MSDEIYLEHVLSYLGGILEAPERGDALIRNRWPQLTDLLVEFRIYHYTAVHLHSRLSYLLAPSSLSVLDKHIQANYTRNILLFRQAAELAREFESAGIRLVFLKGAAAVPRRLFLPKARWMSDIDALIPAGDTEKARCILRDLGYHPGPERVPPHFHHIEPMYHPRHLGAVELHVKPYGYSVNGDAVADDMLRNAERSTIEGTDIRVPSPTDHAWMLARKDVISHTGVRLKDALEMALLAGSGLPIDYDILYRREADDMPAHCVDALLFASRRFFHAPVEPSASCDVRRMEDWIAWSMRHHRQTYRKTPFPASRNRYGAAVFHSAPGIGNTMRFISWIAGWELRNEHPSKGNALVYAVHKCRRYLKDYLTHTFYSACGMLNRR